LNNVKAIRIFGNIEYKSPDEKKNEAKIKKTDNPRHACMLEPQKS